MNYWEECLKEAFCEAEISANEKQLKICVEYIEGAYENFSLATGLEFIPNPIDEENKTLKKKLHEEENKVFCLRCNGGGRITENFGIRSSDSECDRCKGRGKY